MVRHAPTQRSGSQPAYDSIAPGVPESLRRGLVKVTVTVQGLYQHCILGKDIEELDSYLGAAEVEFPRIDGATEDLHDPTIDGHEKFYRDP